MRALVFDAPASDMSSTRIAELPIPDPGPGQVSIDVAYAGINFKDIMARRGDPGYVTGWPFVPGLEVTGRVRAVGTLVRGLQPGQSVAALTGAGGLAEVAVADAALTVAVPVGVSLDRAAAAPGALTSAALLVEEFARVRDGDVVLVHGASGGVGQAVGQLARSAGARLVLGTVGSPSRADAEQAGYDAVLVRGPQLVPAVEQRVGRGGVDVVLDPQGTALVDIDLRLSAPGARIVLFGNAAGGPLSPLPGLPSLMAANVSIAGFSLAALAAAAPGRVASALARVLDRLAVGDLDIELVTE